MYVTFPQSRWKQRSKQRRFPRLGDSSLYSSLDAGYDLAYLQSLMTPGGGAQFAAMDAQAQQQQTQQTGPPTAAAPDIGDYLDMAFSPPSNVNCPWWYWLEGNALVCEQQPQLIAAGQAQVLQVADNAATYYGQNSAPAAAAAQTAQVQAAQVPGDVATIASEYGVNPSDLSVAPFSIPWYVWAMGAAAVAIFAFKG